MAISAAVQWRGVQVPGAYVRVLRVIVDVVTDRTVVMVGVYSDREAALADKGAIAGGGPIEVFDVELYNGTVTRTERRGPDNAPVDVEVPKSEARKPAELWAAIYAQLKAMPRFAGAVDVAEGAR